MSPERRVLRKWGLPIVGGVLVLLAIWWLAGLVYWKGTGVGPSPPLPMPYGESFTHHRPSRVAEAAPAPPEAVPVAALWGDNSVTQSFRACAQDLTQMRVWLAGPEGTEVFVELRDGRAQSDVLYHTRLRLQAASWGRYYDFSFPKLRDSRGRMYYVVLRSPAVSITESVAVRTATGDRVGGTFYVNEFPHPGTLDLTTYHRGWPGVWVLYAVGESTLPRVFRDRLSQYKPAFFKSPTFAILLALSGAGVIGWLLVVLVWGLVKHWISRAWVAMLMMGIISAMVSRWIALPGRPSIAMHAGPVDASTERGRERIVRDLLADLHTASRNPEPRLVTTSWREGKSSIIVPAASKISYGMQVPPGAELRFALGLVQSTQPAVSPDDTGVALAFTVEVNGEELFAQRLEGNRSSEQAQDITLDLAPYAGQYVRLSLFTLPDEDGADVRGLWIAPQVVSTMDWLLQWPLKEQPRHPQRARFGDEIELLGYDAGDVQPGKTVRVMLYWHALQPLDTSYTVFIHLLDETGEIRGQWDSRPVGAAYPTTIWPMDAVVADRYDVPLTPDAPLGAYRLAVGLYDLATLERLPVVDAAGESVPDGRLILGELVGVGE